MNTFVFNFMWNNKNKMSNILSDSYHGSRLCCRHQGDLDDKVKGAFSQGLLVYMSRIDPRPSCCDKMQNVCAKASWLRVTFSRALSQRGWALSQRRWISASYWRTSNSSPSRNLRWKLGGCYRKICLSLALSAWLEIWSLNPDSFSDIVRCSAQCTLTGL